MSQDDILKLLIALNGEATIKEIREYAKKKYPDRTLFLYVTNRLKKLERNKKIIRVGDKWKINT